ncbi:MAG: flavoprotein [Thermosphaera sp.]
MGAVAWGITGAGPFLEESVETILELLHLKIPVTVYCSKAGEALLDYYGLTARLADNLKGPYPTGLVLESREAPGFPSTGRLYSDIYRFAVISPATLNTSSKIIYGISDSLVTNLASHALKNNIELFILPVDYFETSSRIPLKVDRRKCSQCSQCVAANACPTGALMRDDYWIVRVEPFKCKKCYKCLDHCPFDAIKFDVEITLKPNAYYKMILDNLKEMPGVKIIKHPREILKLLESV